MIKIINKFDEAKAFDYENGFYLTSKPYRMGNILAHYELYKKILNLPGAVVELGVFKGASLIQWSTFRELLENENSRKIIGFDAFGEFPACNATTGEDIQNSDKDFIDNWNKNFKDDFVSREEIYKSLELKGFNNINLIQGDILKTLPDYVSVHDELRIALLHIDTDVYEPCMAGLKILFDKVVKNGVIVFDDYSTIGGETKAVDKFFADKQRPVLNKFSFSHGKPVYMIKDF